jgi:hypothetical protein
MFKSARQVFDDGELDELGAKMQELKQAGEQVGAV